MKEFADRFREQILSLLNGKTDHERSEVPFLHPLWMVDMHYCVGDIVRIGDQLYKCLLEHDSQASWTPDVAPSLWTKIMYREGIRIIPEIIEATQAFALDECGWWGDSVYRSLINGNAYTPEQYPAGWEIISEEPAEEPIEEPTEEPAEVPQEWQSGTAYSIDDAVLFDGAVYKSIIANNVWSPADYPAGWEAIE